MQAFDEYKRRGGNSWIDIYWQDQLPKIHERMKKRFDENKARIKQSSENGLSINE
jgi:hypothetical protein